MSAALVPAIMGALITLLLVGIAGAILMMAGYRLRPTSVNLGFMTFETSRFGDLSPVQLFEQVSRVIIPPSADAQNWFDKSTPEATPVLLIHVGWNIVADAYVRKYSALPSEPDVESRISDLGPQNAEFVVIFKRVYDQSVRHGENVGPDFAREYFLRAPSLATRISGIGFADQEALFNQIAHLLPASDGVQVG